MYDKVKKINSLAELKTPIQSILVSDGLGYLIEGREIAIPIDERLQPDNNSKNYLLLPDVLKNIIKSIPDITKIEVNQKAADWKQSDPMESNFIQNKPTALSQFENDEEFICRNDLEELKRHIKQEFLSKEVLSDKYMPKFTLAGSVSSIIDLENVVAEIGSEFMLLA